MTLAPEAAFVLASDEGQNFDEFDAALRCQGHDCIGIPNRLFINDDHVSTLRKRLLRPPNLLHSRSRRQAIVKEADSKPVASKVGLCKRLVESFDVGLLSAQVHVQYSATVSVHGVLRSPHTGVDKVSVRFDNAWRHLGCGHCGKALEAKQVLFCYNHLHTAYGIPIGNEKKREFKPC